MGLLDAGVPMFSGPVRFRSVSGQRASACGRRAARRSDQLGLPDEALLTKTASEQRSPLPHLYRRFLAGWPAIVRI